MRLAALLLILLGGCAHTHVNINSGNPPPVQGGAQVRLHLGSTASTLLGLAIITTGMIEMERDGVRYRANPFMTMTAGNPEPAPELSPTRTVNEQDCSKPIEDSSANLRCR